MAYLDGNGLLYFWQKIKNAFALKADSIKNITRSGTTFTATRADGTTFTFTQQDNNTTYTAASATPLMDGTGAAGSSAKYAREDHVHPSDDTKVDKVTGKGLSSNDFTNDMMNKLDGIEAGAQANRTYTSYTGIPTADQAPAFGGTVKIHQVSQSTTGQVSGTERTITIPDTKASTSAFGIVKVSAGNGLSVTAGAVSMAEATGSASGAMSASDKLKLAGIEAGAQANENAFGKVTVQTYNGTEGAGASHFTALDPSDTVTLEGRRGIALTGDTGEGCAVVERQVDHFVCETAASTAAKTAGSSSGSLFYLYEGLTVYIKFTVTNTAAVASLKLNVAGTGGKPVKYRGGNLPSAGTLAANRIYCFIYLDGNWNLVGDVDTNTTYSSMTQADATAGTATTARLISAKVLNDTIEGRIEAAQTGAAMFRGTVSAGTDISGLTSYSRGWYWVVASAGTYAGQECEPGDMVFCVEDRGSAYSAGDFSIVQNNIVTITNTEIDTIVAS